MTMHAVTREQYNAFYQLFFRDADKFRGQRFGQAFMNHFNMDGDNVLWNLRVTREAMKHILTNYVRAS